MIDRDFFSERSVQLSLVALAASLAFGGWELTRAVRLDPVAEGTPLKINAGDALMKPAPYTPSDVVAVVALNVFSQDRAAPKRRYRLAGYTEVKAPELPKPVVYGTGTSAGDRSFAIVKVGDTPTTIVRVGNVIGGYTVKSIERGLVVFATPTGERLAINATRP